MNPVTARIVLAFAVWALVVALLTGPGNVDVLVVLLLIGLLVLREVAGPYATEHVRDRLDVFVLFGLVGFVVVVVQRVMAILNL